MTVLPVMHGGEGLLCELYCKLKRQRPSFTDFIYLPRVYLQCTSGTEDSVNFSVCKIASLLHTVSAHDISTPSWNGRAVFMLVASLAAMVR